MSQRFSNTRWCTVDITTDSAAYGDGDVIGGLQRVRRALHPYREGVLKTLQVIDPGADNAPLTILFFNDLPAGTMADQGALSLTDAEFRKCVGVVSIAAGDYVTPFSGVSVAVKDVGAVMQGYYGDTDVANADAGVGDLWMIVLSEGTPDYDAETLRINLGFLAD